MALSAFLGRRLALSGVALSVVLGCGGEFKARSGSDDGGVASGGKPGKGDGGAPGSGGDVDAGTPGSGGVSRGTGGVASGGRPGTGGRGSGGRSTGGAGTGGGSTGGSGTGGASTGGTAGTPGTGGTATGGTGTGGSSTTQLASNYDQKCTYDGECGLVAQGDLCTCNARCPNAAIAATAISQWNADRPKLLCPDPPACPAIACVNVIPACAIGKCTVRKPFNVDPTHYDQQCASNGECVQIFTGEVCSSCQCSIGAVSEKGYQDYLRDRANNQCTPGPSACDCFPSGHAQCVIPVGQDKGTCTVVP